ncbi:unnamed protein product [Orchesella dallaii]|uniref:J domain-containing protein n=1 Tax=Orchesella dallaii TaxID=48710 RepID=A0ABP1RKV6_9HEXA
MLPIKKLCCRTPDLKMLLSRQVHKSFYDSLGLTPKASQADIKRAYYEKSMVYHPDKGKGSAEVFKEISTAYEVLGNNKLRKMYDKGMLPLGAAGYAAVKEKSKTQPEPSVDKKAADRKKAEQFYENINATFDESARKKKTYTGKSSQYDYDAWTEAHYAETFSRQEAEKAEHQRRRREREHATRFAAAQKADKMFTLAGVIIWVGFMMYFRDIYTLQYDKPSNKRPPQS